MKKIIFLDLDGTLWTFEKIPSSALEAIEKFVKNYPDKNILVIEVPTEDDTYFYGFLNKENLELNESEIEKRFIK